MPPNNLFSVAALRRSAVARLAAAGSPTPGLDADTLLTAALNRDRAFVLAHGETIPTPAQAARIHDWIDRAAAGEPIAYLLGRRGFYDLELIVSPAVLIPRPETERLLEHALAWGRDRLARRGALTAADIGTGSGALAVTLAHHLPAAVVHASDISPAALTIARLNAAQYAPNVIFHMGDLLRPLLAAGVTVDLLLANLPYIPDNVVPGLAVSRHEPKLALAGGADGLALIAALLAAAPGVLAANGLILLEIGADQGAAAAALAAQHLPTAAIAVHRDYAELDRIVAVQA